MAHRRSSIKKIRTDKKRHAVNVVTKSNLKTATKKMSVQLASKNHTEAVKTTRDFFSVLDKTVKKGLVHPNKAARTKSRIQKRVNALAKA